MKILKKSQRTSPKISIILLDWGVRESFHFLYYISKQNINRDLFEIVIIEYYANISPAIQKFSDEVDSWILLEMPSSAYYHKHLMYNAGLLMSQGEYVIICDSDAMVKPTFLDSVLQEFSKNPNIVLHLDQFRNNRRDLYPFNYPSFEEVIGRGCINHVNGKTTGLSVKKDVIHNRNYGACFCAKRDLLIQIGGADEHIDFIGHICGPYDLTFRLINLGCKEIWHETEFLYHTWHPGQAGENNYLGPHDGKHMSTTSLEALYNFRIYPHVENQLISKLRQGIKILEEDLQNKLIAPEYSKITKFEFLSSSENRKLASETYQYMLNGGYKIFYDNGKYYAASRFVKNQDIKYITTHATFIYDSFEQLTKSLKKTKSISLTIIRKIIISYIFAARAKSIITSRLRCWIFYNRKLKSNQATYAEKSIIVSPKQNLKQISKTNIIKPFTLICKSFKFIWYKYNNSKKDQDYYWDHMLLLLSNIKLAHKENQNVTLLISSVIERLFLYLVRKFKLIPKINLIKYNDFSDIKNYLNNLNPDFSQIVLLSKQLYVDNILNLEEISIDTKKYFIV